MTLVLIGAVVVIAYHFVAGFYWNLDYPEATFLFKPSDHFQDWYHPYEYATAFVKGGRRRSSTSLSGTC